MSKLILSDTSKLIHLVGIGGVSMSALAEVLNFRGFVVTGSDMNEGEHIDRLRRLGIKISIGHKSENVKDADIVIRTSAIHDDNPEIVCAAERELPILERAEAWGEIMRDYKNVLCIAGTHGKTTTTSMATHIALEARLDPQVMVGANLPVIGGNLRVATGDLFIAESCEYCNSFLSFSPTVAVVANVEEDHLDFFSGIEDIINSFRAFCNLVPEEGYVVYNADDMNACKVVEGLQKSLISFGIDSGEIRAENIRANQDGVVFNLSRDGEVLTEIKLSVSGRHNIYNALAAATSALVLGVSPKCIAAGLSKFSGASRRFEFKGTCNNAPVYDDYAHHPSEVSATLSAARSREPKRIICAFQPHTYTRTAALAKEFAKALSLADIVYVADIFAAREKPVDGVTSKLITDLLDGAENIHSFEEIADKIRKVATADDMILTMGAGDIYKVAEMLCR